MEGYKYVTLTLCVFLLSLQIAFSQPTTQSVVSTFQDSLDAQWREDLYEFSVKYIDEAIQKGTDSLTISRLYYAAGDLITGHSVTESPTILLKKGLLYIPDTLRNKSLEHAKMLVALGKTYGTLELFNRSSIEYFKALSVAQNSAEKIDTIEAIVYLWTGVNYMKLRKRDSSLYYLEKSKSIYRSLYGPESIYLARTIYRIGMLSYYHGDFDTAMTLYSKSLKMMRDIDPKSTHLGNLLHRIGLCHISMGRFHEALKTFDEEFANYDQWDQNTDFMRNNTYSDIGLAYTHLGEYQKAEQAYIISDSLYRSLGDSTKTNRWNLSSWAYNQSKQQKYSAALEKYKQSLDFLIRIYGPQFPKVIQVRSWLVETYLDMNNLAEAQKQNDMCNNGLNNLLQGDIDSSQFLFYRIQPLMNTALINYKQYQLSKDSIQLIAAVESAQEAIKYIIKIKNYLSNNPDQVYYKSKEIDHYNQAIQLALAAYSELGDSTYLEQTLVMADQAKSEVLSQSHYKNTVKEIPAIHALNSDSPALNPIEFNTQILRLIQKSLTQNQVVLYYFTDIHDFYMCAIGQQKISYFELGPIARIDSIAHQTYAQLTQRLDLNENTKRLDSLLLPINLDQMTQSELIVIPHGSISMIPFEILWRNDQYLISKYQICYYPSLLLQHLLAKKKPKENSKMLIISPETGLQGAQDEVDLIKEKYSAQVYKSDKIVKENLFSEIGRYNLIHFATHGQINTDDYAMSYLQIGKSNSDNLPRHCLFAHEIENLQLNAELVTLSACNTGNGKLVNGQGVMSLSRSFNMAGARSTVLTLWDIPDLAASHIFKKFYLYLSQEIPKDEALRKSKLDYLASNLPQAMKHPYYWAGPVAQGSTTPISFEENQNPNWIKKPLIALFLVGAVFFLFTYIRVSKSSKS